MTTDLDDPFPTTRRITYALVAVSVIIIPINFLVYVRSWSRDAGDAINAFVCLCVAQTVLGLFALISGIVLAVRLRKASKATKPGVVSAIVGTMAAIGGVGGFVLGIGAMAIASGGGAWGRPLRIRGKVRHPELRRGGDWTRGDRPDPSGLDEPTRAALEALWLHDAQKEHASVPAFSRVAWMLCAVGAPAELLTRTFRAATEEIDHAERCFALAAGYAGRTHTVEPMPELLLDGALEVRGDALVHLAVESLEDGCLLEDYNADVAAACALVCREPVTRAVLEQIAVEERSHAELSWSILAYCVARGEQPVLEAIRRARANLPAYARPTAVSVGNADLVQRANPASLRDHGRLPDAEWKRIFEGTLERTRVRLDRMLGDAVLTRGRGPDSWRGAAQSPP